MKVRCMLAGLLVVVGAVPASATVIFQTSFEGSERWAAAWATDPSHPIEALPDPNTYRPFYGDGTMGAVNGNSGSVSAGTLGDNWTVLPSNSKTGIDLVRGWVTPGFDALQWIDLIGTSGPGGIQRTFHVDAGTTYRLTWLDYSNMGGQEGVNGGRFYQALFGGTDTGITGYGGVNVLTGATNTWTQRQLTFVADATGDATLRFYSADGSNGNTGIDRVVLEAVPEPFTTALGLAGLGIAALRRRARKS